MTKKKKEDLVTIMKELRSDILNLVKDSEKTLKAHVKNEAQTIRIKITCLTITPLECWGRDFGNPSPRVVTLHTQEMEVRIKGIPLTLMAGEGC